MFFFVFWGVVSLFVSLFLIGVGLAVIGVGAPAFMEGRRAALERAAASASATNGEPARQPTLTAQEERDAYIAHKLVLYGFSASYTESILDGKVPGVLFKIRNDGDRTLNRVEVTVYFQDRAGTTIAEEKYYPVLVAGYGMDTKPLKPNYIWQMERGKFYSAKKVPTEWEAGRAEAKISDIGFAETGE